MYEDRENPQKPISPKPTVEDGAPGYWKEEGGAHLTVRTAAGVQASALRQSRDWPWEVFDPYENRFRWESHYSNEAVVHLLKDQILRAMESDLATLYWE